MEPRRVAVTSADRNQVTGHAGKCQTFWVVDVERDTIRNFALLELEAHQTLHAVLHERDHTSSHPLDGIEALITGGMGQGLARRLEERSIRPVVTSETDVERAVTSFLSGDLEEGTARAKVGCGHGCGGHHHHHHH